MTKIKVKNKCSYKGAWVKIKLILSVASYGCETWSLTARDEHRLGLLNDVCERNAEEIIWTQDILNIQRRGNT
jgi:hypothetical protein